MNGSHAETSNSYEEKKKRFSLCLSLLSQHNEVAQSLTSCQIVAREGNPNITYSGRHSVISAQCGNDLINQKYNMHIVYLLTDAHVRW